MARKAAAKAKKLLPFRKLQDLIDANDNGIQSVLKEIEHDVLSLALVGTLPQVQVAFFRTGVIAFQCGDNPRIVERKCNAFFLVTDGASGAGMKLTDARVPRSLDHP